MFATNTNALLPSLLAPFATLRSLLEKGVSALPLPVELVVCFGVLYREVGYALESAVSSHQLRIVVSSNACDENIWGAERLATIN
ncbi:hypothetical protein KY092_20350 [Natronomonas gomsonensis]|nr:hypothetical protein [Natronomonas gomsonensis]MCY4732886.1 hypothetical protein [Natronomonas gomsonensis]